MVTWAAAERHADLHGGAALDLVGLNDECDMFAAAIVSVLLPEQESR